MSILDRIFGIARHR